jgi:hypothetical protein
MRAVYLFAFFCSFFAWDHLHAQSPNAIEEDVAKSFKKIAYWNAYRFSHAGSADTAAYAYDSVGNANKIFREKLTYYTSKYPFTLNAKFKDLDSTGLSIITSNDGLLRIYSWDNSLGGTMRFYESVIQYKAGPGVKAIVKADTTSVSGSYYYHYSNIYTLKANGRTYYLAIYFGRFSTKDMALGIQVFSIENGILSDKVNIIKTADGLSSNLFYNFNIFSVSGHIKDAKLLYNGTLKTISLPVVVAHGKVTKARIIYKFNGQYFERVKN